MSTYIEDILATSGLQSFWKLDEASGTFVDAKGAHNSTAVSGVTYGESALVKNDTSGKAAKFTEGNSKVSFGEIYEFSGTSSYSFEFWFKRNENSGDRILGFRGTNGGKPVQWQMRISSNEYKFQRIDEKTEKLNFLEVEKTVTTGTTYHVVGTFDGSTMRLFVNGTEIKSQGTTNSMSTSTGEFTIGQSFGNAGSALRTTIDDVSIYNTALSGAEIKAHYEKGIEEGKKAETVEGKATVSGTGTVNSAGVRVKTTGASVAGIGAVSSAGLVIHSPTVTTLPATEVKTTTAVLNGEVNPNNGSTTYWFEYGTSGLYGLETEHKSAGSGSSPVAKSEEITGLLPGVTYHFRMVAENSVGKTNGADIELTEEKEKVTGAATVTGTGSITSAGLHTAFGAGSVAGTGTIQAAGFKTTSTGAKVEGTGSISGSFEQPYRDAVLATSGLQSYWRLDETSSHFKDSKGSVESTVEESLIRGANGLLSSEHNAKAVEMDAKADKISFGNNYQFTAKANFTIELWIQAASLGNYNIISKRYAASNAWFIKLHTNGSIEVSRFNSSAEGNGANSPEGTIEAGKRYHVVGTYDGSKLKMYVNGVLKKEESSTKEVGSTSSALNLGQGFESDTGMPGVYDELAIYNVALSESTVKAHYEAGILATKGTIAGIGSVSGKGGILRTGQANVSGTGTIAPKGTRVREGKGNVAGTGTITTAGQSTKGGKGNVVGTGSITAKGLHIAIGKSTVSGTGYITAVPDTFKLGKATVSGTGSVSATGSLFKGSGGNIEGTGTVVGSGERIIATGAEIAEITGITATAIIKTTGSATIFGRGVIQPIGFSRQFLVNPPSFLILEKTPTALRLEGVRQNLVLDPGNRSLDLDADEQTLTLDQ